MEESFVSGYFDFVIRGVNLNPDEITEKMNLQPTRVNRIGEVIFKNVKMKDSLWSYQVTFNNYDELNQSLEKLLSDIIPCKDAIHDLKKLHDVYIFFSFGSNLGQLGFELESHIIKGLAELGIRFEVHILSYGEVEDEEEENILP